MNKRQEKSKPLDRRELICIGCPLGCRLQVDLEADGSIGTISGYLCKRGKDYAVTEVLEPRRMVTSLIPVPGSRIPLSVRTREAIPKALIRPCLEAIRAIRITLPVRSGDVVQADIVGSGIDLIATRDLPE